MIALQEVEEYHNGLIDQFGGSKGVRDIAGLEAAMRIENITLIASQKEKYDMAISASMGEIHFNEIKDWITTHSIQIR